MGRDRGRSAPVADREIITTPPSRGGTKSAFSREAAPDAPNEIRTGEKSCDSRPFPAPRGAPRAFEATTAAICARDSARRPARRRTRPAPGASAYPAGYRAFDACGCWRARGSSPGPRRGAGLHVTGRLPRMVAGACSSAGGRRNRLVAPGATDCAPGLRGNHRGDLRPGLGEAAPPTAPRTFEVTTAAICARDSARRPARRRTRPAPGASAHPAGYRAFDACGCW